MGFPVLDVRVHAWQREKYAHQRSLPGGHRFLEPRVGVSPVDFDKNLDDVEVVVFDCIGKWVLEWVFYKHFHKDISR